MTLLCEQNQGPRRRVICGRAWAPLAAAAEAAAPRALVAPREFCMGRLRLSRTVRRRLWGGPQVMLLRAGGPAGDAAARGGARR